MHTYIELIFRMVFLSQVSTVIYKLSHYLSLQDYFLHVVLI